ncbi:MAG: GTPase domain-containing protein, partial [Acidobacteriota bacterium]
VGIIEGFRTRFQLYTVHGQVFYGETRRMVLKGLDGIVFVADSQKPMVDANVESLRDLEENLKSMDLTIRDIPLVFQFNKRDLSNIASVETLQKALNTYNWSYFEAVAIQGKGVFDTLKAISRLTLRSVRHKLKQPAAPKVHVMDLPPLSKEKPPDAKPSAATAPPPLPQPRTARNSEEAVSVEFATRRTKSSDEELAQMRPKMKTVTALTDVAKELDRIRNSLLGPLTAPSQPKMKDLTPALADLEKKGRENSEQILTLEVPVEAADFKRIRELKIHIVLEEDGAIREIPETLTVKGSELAASGSGQVLKLYLKPKKA